MNCWWSDWRVARKGESRSAQRWCGNGRWERGLAEEVGRGQDDEECDSVSSIAGVFFS